MWVSDIVNLPYEDNACWNGDCYCAFHISTQNKNDADLPFSNFLFMYFVSDF